MDATVDHTSAAVVAAGRVGDVIALEVVEHLPGVGWVGPFLIDLAKRWPAPIVVDVYGPLSAVAGELERAGLPVHRIGVRQVVEAAAMFADNVTLGRIGHGHDFRLADAVASVGRRKVGDRWAFNRRGADISPLVAASLAAWTVQTNVYVKSAIY